WYNWNL
ncbi:hypothetical protein KL938_005417, partial [Ogataea parapolymorpha]